MIRQGLRWATGPLLALAWLMAAPAASADVTGLQLNPLRIEDTLGTTVKTGYIDVANPGDSTITVVTRVQGFRQNDLEGRLAFFDDADLAGGIKVSLEQFELGPREAVRVGFLVDPAKLPQGGVYASIFFQTIPPAQSSNTSYVSESAKVGTLLMLTNGLAGKHQGEISRLNVPLVQTGVGIGGQLTYRNTDRSRAPVGFNPALTTRVLPWGDPKAVATGLVLPGSSRQFEVVRPGAYFGLLPITVTDQDTGRSRTAWVLACTGWYQLAVPAVLITLVLLLVIFAHPLRRLLARLLRRHSRRARYFMDL